MRIGAGEGGIIRLVVAGMLAHLVTSGMRVGWSVQGLSLVMVCQKQG